MCTPCWTLGVADGRVDGFAVGRTVVGRAAGFVVTAGFVVVWPPFDGRPALGGATRATDGSSVGAGPISGPAEVPGAVGIAVSSGEGLSATTSNPPTRHSPSTAATAIRTTATGRGVPDGASADDPAAPSARTGRSGGDWPRPPGRKG